MKRVMAIWRKLRIQRKRREISGEILERKRKKTNVSINEDEWHRRNIGKQANINIINIMKKAMASASIMGENVCENRK